MSTDRQPTATDVACLALACALAISACASRRSPQPIDWMAGELVPYRLVSKEDFLAKASNSAWGNFAHGAEICVHILPADDGGGAFRALMKRECSFWNKVMGPVGFFGRIAALFSPVPVPVPVKQPDWYILQHEQVHFAIMQVAALTLTRQLEQVSASRRTRQLVRSAYSLTLFHVRDRHREFDLDTSGTFRPDDLEKWVRVLEIQMRELCGSEDNCPVRQSGY